ncbi:vitellogenin-like [Harpegnathos saltator]|uniref:vitellogenin-like n=1 Tax=Harpegnathos saltator TaxID=610380 RepID=UPI00058BA308|nr:vitellogenin-like [Harpegnathos saltator]
MWAPLALLLFVSSALAHTDLLIWKPNHTYHYRVETQGLAGMNKVSQQFAGLQLRGELVIEVTEPNVLLVHLQNVQHTQILKELQDSWHTKVSDQQLHYKNSWIQTTYKVDFQHGNMQKIYTEPQSPRWQLNVMKGILSQLQLSIVEPEDLPMEKASFSEFIVDEQSVSGHCNTSYNIQPMAKSQLELHPLVRIPALKDEMYWDVMKTRNYRDCLSMPMYQFSIVKNMDHDIHERYLKRSTQVNMVISRDKDDLTTIRSSVMKGTIDVRPKLNDFANSNILTKMKLTLTKLEPMTEMKDPPLNLVPAGNLLYVHHLMHDHQLDKTRIEPKVDYLETDPKSDKSHESSSSEKASSSNFLRRSIHQKLNRFGNNFMSNTEFHDREYGYFISKAEMHESMNNVLPSILGLNKNDGSKMLDPAEMMKQVVILVNEMVSEVQSSDEVLRQHTLEKFMMLTSLLRHLNEKELATVENDLSPKILPQKSKEPLLRWKIWRDAVVQAGTGPAFLTIRGWILEKKVRDFEAAQLLSRLPRVVHMPTAEYIKAFFELLKEPSVKNEFLLNTTAPYAFAELVRYVMVWDQKFFYPVRTFGMFVNNEEKKALTDVYIPYLAQELMDAQQKHHNSKILTYIIALGNIGHPAIVPVLEPYLEGKLKITSFQRMTIVASLRKLMEHQPDVVRPIVYRIYQNDKEHQEVRIAAVQLLMMSHPPLDMLKRMAERTHYEPNGEVNNAVVTGIRYLSKLSRERNRQDAHNAQAVRKLLNPKVKPNMRESYIFGQDYVNEQKEFEAAVYVNTIRGFKRFSPASASVELGTNRSHLSPPNLKIAVASTGSELLLRLLQLLFHPNLPTKSLSAVDAVAKNLQIPLQDEELLETSFVMDSEYAVNLIVLDKHEIFDLLESFLRVFKLAEEDKSDLMLASMMSWELAISYPSELGLPVTYRLQKPQLGYMRSKLHWKDKPNPYDLQMDVELDVLLSRKVMSRLDFVTVFDNQRYLSGFDVNMQLHLPAKLKLHVDEAARQLNVVYEPPKDKLRTTLLHYSVVPHNAIVDFCTIKPVLLHEQAYILYWKQPPSKTVENMGDLVITIETDHFRPNVTMQNFLFPVVVEQITQLIDKDVHYNKIEVGTKFDPNTDNTISFTISYDDILPPNDMLHKRIEDDFEISDDLWMSEMKKISKQHKSDPKAMKLVRMDMKIPNKHIHWHMNETIMQHSEHDTTMHYKAILQTSHSAWKFAAVLDLESAPSACPTLDLHSKHHNIWNALLHYESPDKTKQTIHLLAIQEQSEELNNFLVNSEMHKKCMMEKERHTVGLKNCQEFCKFIDQKDEMHMTMKVGNKPFHYMKYLFLKALAAHLMPIMHLELEDWEPQPQEHSHRSISVMVNKPLYDEMLNITMVAPPLRAYMHMDLIDLPDSFFNKHQLELLFGQSDARKCVLSADHLVSFNGLEYSVRLGQKHPYVLLINPTRQGLNERSNLISAIQGTPDETNVAVLVQQLDNGRRSLIIMKKERTVEILPPAPGSTDVRILVDGQNLESPLELWHTLTQLDIHISTLPSNVHEILLDSSEITIWYDSTNVQIKASDKYNGELRGLCGAKANIREHQLITPAGCYVEEPADVVELYAYDPANEDPLVEKAKEYATKNCIEHEHHQTDYVTDLETGKATQQQLWREKFAGISFNHYCTTMKTHWLEKDDEYCFSLRPLPYCNEGCKPTKMVSKAIAHFCEPINSEVVALKNRIQSGANPDFRDRKVSLHENLQVPASCRP